MARVPLLRPLHNKTICVAGLGALGAPAALELARAQVGELRLLDFDHVEYGTTVRWPMGIDAVMHQKGHVIATTVAANYIYVNATVSEHQLGLPPQWSPRSESEQINEFLDGADLLLDLTAERGINYLLSREAEERQLPQVYAWGTEGGWGGAVVRILPGETGCWYCLMLHLDENTIAPPPTDPTGFVQPRSCASLAYTGTSFDLLPIAAQAVRVAVQTALRTEAGAYPDGANDAMILSLRSPDGTPITPRWQDYPLTRHPNCPYCPSASS